MWNPWKHIRLAGAIVVIVGAFMHILALTLLGLAMQYLGVVAAVDRLERIIDLMVEKEDNNGLSNGE